MGKRSEIEAGIEEMRLSPSNMSLSLDVADESSVGNDVKAL